ncbi:MAG: hydrogenase expression protein HupH [Acidimicrobiaceae bacterium]|nr:hydrogenase expression protein HupH [Acidimicrobiaceae bacterium]
MHEFSLCRAIAATVESHADGRPVSVVRITVGHFRQVVPDSMVHCWELQVHGTELDGSRLVIDEVPAVIECAGCGARTTLELPVHRCGQCDSLSTRLISGEEFLIDSIDIHTTPEEV